MTSLVRVSLTYYVESCQSDICCFRAITLSLLHTVVNWPVFTVNENALEYSDIEA